MSKQIAKKSLIPQLDGRALDFIKICAAVFMVIDHAGLIWYGEKTWYMTLIGRAAFPLFCYAVAVAVGKMDQARVQSYAARLLLMAVLVEPVSELTRHQGMANILFTLAAGALFADLSRRLKEGQVLLCYGLAAASMAVLKLPIEFGLAGVVLPSAILLVLEGRGRFLPLLLMVLLFLNAGGLVESVAGAPPGITWAGISFGMLTVWLCAALLPYATLLLARDLRQDGRYLPRYFLYAFYPGHLLALWILGRLFF